jgi:hypothetical protein
MWKVTAVVGFSAALLAVSPTSAAETVLRYNHPGGEQTVCTKNGNETTCCTSSNEGGSSGYRSTCRTDNGMSRQSGKTKGTHGPGSVGTATGNSGNSGNPPPKKVVGVSPPVSGGKKH